MIDTIEKFRKRASNVIIVKRGNVSCCAMPRRRSRASALKGLDSILEGFA